MDRIKPRKHVYNGMPARDLGSEGWHKPWSGGNGGNNAPTRDLELETLAGVLRGEILVHNHCYRADEMAQMIDIADEFGYSIRSFHHGVEAYKIADVLAEEDISASIWADWWGFKMEAMDFTIANVALVHDAGLPMRIAVAMVSFGLFWKLDIYHPILALLLLQGIAWSLGFRRKILREVGNITSLASDLTAELRLSSSVLVPDASDLAEKMPDLAEMPAPLDERPGRVVGIVAPVQAERFRP